ncbi:penicillin-binding protein 2B [Paenibacillus sp. J31TS4]|uniref:penicillin-binding transpeptidase domain-containing protein n=1 Tax=Paenibacillus sp. J31TS4 TaxID=2807195 RepID=UPI001B23F442|nr:penicillin-binding transpeptidase domain-containing protein [Paenibacillus sp. J31TS4]GIP39672.1 penicillin-binding protein 2B [Paenibacillus sp. J31TS4]
MKKQTNLKRIKLRSLALGFVFTMIFLTLVGRMYWIQVVDAAWLQSQAEQKWKEDEVLRAKRGSIVDRNGKTLAEDTIAYIVTLNPKIIHSKKIEKEVSQGLAQVLSESQDSTEIAKLEDKIYKLATKTKDDGKTLMTEVEVRNEGYKIDADKYQKIRDLIADIKEKTGVSLTGINLRESQNRLYPNNRLASHVIGYTDRDGKAIGGIEQKYNTFLSGTNGTLSRERDKMGVQLPDSKITMTPAVDGNDVRLTIDQNIQFYIEKALREAYTKWKPKSLTAVAVDPSTMEILGMSSIPDFNPNKFWEVNAGTDYINRAVGSQFEPGSTFKIVTLAGAIEEGLFNPNDFYQSGTYNVPGRPVHDYNRSGWGRISYLEGLQRSSNVAFAILGYERLQKERLQDYMTKFGFGTKTGIDLPAEANGKINMTYPSDIARATFGQSITTTVIQQVAAYGAIANGGKLMQPYIVKDIVNPDTGEVVQSFQPKVVRQVVSEQTAKKTTEYLEKTVDPAYKSVNTGWRAAVDGYRVAGKTGTANIVPEGKSTYSDNTWYISFIGYAPADNPKVIVAVMADQPDLGGDFHKAGELTGPVFKEIMSQTLAYLKVPPDTSTNTSETSTEIDAASPTVEVPDVTATAKGSAQQSLEKAGLKVELLGKGSKVVGQYPAAGTRVTASQTVYLATEEPSSLGVPEMKGKSMREALELCSFLGVTCQTNGEGYVVSQTVTEENGQQLVHLELQPLDPAAVKAAAAGGSAGKSGDKAGTAASDKKAPASSTPPPSKKDSR